MSEAVTPTAAKVDPETLAIRAKPARAIRFRRGVIITIAALGSVSLMTVAWVALKPRVFSAVTEPRELSESGNRPSTDALNGLPASYGEAPRLGPPLPGDLGRPILTRQRAMATETGIGTGADTNAQHGAQARERQLAELRAARESGLLVQGRTSARVSIRRLHYQRSRPPREPPQHRSLTPTVIRTRRAARQRSSVRSTKVATPTRISLPPRRRPICFLLAASYRPASSPVCGPICPGW